MNNILQRIPLLRVLTPLIAGLCLYYIFSFSYIIVVILCSILLYASLTIRKGIYNKDIIIYTIIIAVSYFNTSIQNTQPSPIFNEECNIIARIDKITDNESSMKIEATTIQYITSSNIIQQHKEKISLSIQGNNYLLHPGHLIIFKNKLRPIKNPGNPDEFDYKKYCNHRYIYNQQYLHKEEYKIIGELHTFSTYCSIIRNKIISKILSNHYLNAESQNFLITVLLGAKEYFDTNIKESFVNVGLAHILALSGLHIGIIVYFIYLLLFPLDYIYNKKLRLGITLIILFLYAMLTGLSASVSRATLLFAFGFTAITMNRKINSYNILCAIAILLLIINPNNIFDVGFQLSFIAVLSILLFSNLINRIRYRNNIIRYIINLIVLSVSAVIGTGIISAYYFNNLPLLFIIPNIIIVPLLPVILSIGILAIIFNSQVISYLFNFVYNTIQGFVQFIDSIPYSNINYIYISGFVLSIYFIAITICIYYLYQKKFIKGIISVIGAIIIISLANIFESPDKDTLIVFNDYNCTPVMVQSKNRIVIMPAINPEELDSFKKYQKKYLAKHGISDLKIYEDNQRHPEIINPNTLLIGGKYIRIITNSKDNENKVDVPINYLIVTKKYYSNIRKLVSKYNPELIILSADIYDKRLDKIITELEGIGVNYYSIRDNGAFIIH